MTKVIGFFLGLKIIMKLKFKYASKRQTKIGSIDLISHTKKTIENEVT